MACSEQLLVEPRAARAGADARRQALVDSLRSRYSSAAALNDAEAKHTVEHTILREWFGWQRVLDLGDITAARGTEMYLPLWLGVMGALGTAAFNVRVTRPPM